MSNWVGKKDGSFLLIVRTNVGIDIQISKYPAVVRGGSRYPKSCAAHRQAACEYPSPSVRPKVQMWGCVVHIMLQCRKPEFGLCKGYDLFLAKFELR